MTPAEERAEHLAAQDDTYPHGVGCHCKGCAREQADPEFRWAS